MVLYLLVFALLLYASPHMNSKKWMYIWGVYFTLLIGLRSISVGVDTHTYNDMFNYLRIYGYHGYPEPIFGLVMFFCSKLGLSYLLFNIILSSATIGMILWTVNKVKVSYGYAIVCVYTLYFVFYSMNISRQMAAVALLCVSYYWLSKGRILKFFVLVLVATLIHYISIVALLALLWRRLRLSYNNVLALIGLSFCLGLLLSEGVFILLLRYIGDDYVNYLVKEGRSDGFRSGSRFIAAIFLCIFWTVLFLFVYKYIRKDYRNVLWIKLYFLSIFVNNMLMRMELGLRVTLLFSISQVIAIPIFLKNNIIVPKYSSRVIVYVFLSVFFLTFLLSNSAGVLPYKFYGF